MEGLRAALEGKLQQIREDNARQLEEVRRTVDEKLQGTLEQRLGESFRLVSERLEQVHRGLGEMQTLAHGVGDLKRVLANVKVRGTWGEVQLGTLLEQVLTPEQYAANVATREHSPERVEFAIRLPGRGDHPAEPVWLPIDAKFPQEDYQRLLDAHDRADAEGIEHAARALEARVRQSARDICQKYLNPPRTTDFAVMFLPTEGLYAEVIRRSGLTEQLQRECRVIVAGPTTLWAVLNSLQMGFRTLAIQQRSSEVWAVLGAVKTEFGKFGAVLDRVQKKLQEASNVVEDAGRRRRVMERTLRGVEALPEPDAEALLAGPGPG
jgi:DNA recombination protein RmuC